MYIFKYCIKSCTVYLSFNYYHYLCKLNNICTNMIVIKIHSNKNYAFVKNLKVNTISSLIKVIIKYFYFANFILKISIKPLNMLKLRTIFILFM